MSAVTPNAKIILGLKVKQLRQHKNMSFVELSKAAGMSVSYLNEIEKGKKYPKPDKLKSLAQALGVADLHPNDSGPLTTCCLFRSLLLLLHTLYY